MFESLLIGLAYIIGILGTCMAVLFFILYFTQEEQ